MYPAMTPVDREERWKSVTDRDRKRFDELWNEHAASIYAYAARRVGRETAEEVVADVFAVAWRRIGDLPERELPWLYGLGRNVTPASLESVHVVEDRIDDEGGEKALGNCRQLHMGRIDRRWTEQRAPSPEEELAFYQSVLECTETTTGNEWGDLALDSNGFNSGANQPILEEALDEEPIAYVRCFDQVSDD